MRGELIRIVLCVTVLSAGSCTLKNAGMRSLASTGCLAYAGWPPVAAAISESHLDSQVTVTASEERRVGGILGLGEVFAGREMRFPVRVQQLGPQGSFTLVAEPSSVPEGFTGAFYPVLTKLEKKTGPGQLGDMVGLQCPAGQGLFVCGGSGCDPNPQCTVKNGVFADFEDWLTRQIPVGFGYATTVMFPRCTTVGQALSLQRMQCGLGSFLLPGGRVDAAEYEASYVLLASDYATAPPFAQGEMRLNLLQKTDATPTGAISLNFIFVGEANKAAAATPAGQTRLNQVAQEVALMFGSAQPPIRVSTIQAFDYKCEGSADVTAESLATLVQKASAGVPSALEGKAVNVLFVDSIVAEGVQGVILGLSTSIGGPPLNGFESSGVAVVVNPGLDVMGAADRYDLATTITHEVGHFLGLYHLTEGGAAPSGTTNNGEDYLVDTPTCPAPVDRVSCRTANPACCSSGICAANAACPFNHVMWWTTKAYIGAGNADGNLFSPDSSRILQGSVYAR